MKKVLLSFGFIFGSLVSVNAQTALPTNSGAVDISGTATMDFVEEVHNFGNMKQFGDASTAFKFKNNGNSPLIISNAKGSCGCTVPSWPKEPIMPGQESVVRVKYDSKRVGPINKSVTIYSNAANEPTKVIRIKGMIEAAPKDATPTSPVKAAPQGTPVEGH